MTEAVKAHGCIDRIIDRHQGETSSLIQVLLDIQAEKHWLRATSLDPRNLEPRKLLTMLRNEQGQQE